MGGRFGRMSKVSIKTSKEVTGRKNGPLYLVIHHGGRRERVPLHGMTRSQAQAEADEATRRLLRGLEPIESQAPTFRELAERYVREGMGDIAASTARIRRILLEGPLDEHFGEVRITDIGKARLVEWWQKKQAAGLAEKTRRNHLDALSAVFWFGYDREIVDSNPVEAFRKARRRGRGKKRRAAQDASRNIRAIEDPEEMDALLKEAERAGGNTQLVVLLALDAGLRAGEIGGLRWSDIWWGRRANDVRRHLHICNTRPTGGGIDEAPKSGQDRRVALSRRLRAALRARWMELGQPEEGYVVPGFDASNYLKRLRRTCQRAEIDDWRTKDLRDTFASQLLTAGIPLKYISKQLGHASTGVTEAHYARYIAEEYREPMRLAQGEVPADLLARLSAAKTGLSGRGATTATESPQPTPI